MRQCQDKFVRADQYAISPTRPPASGRRAPRIANLRPEAVFALRHPRRRLPFQFSARSLIRDRREPWPALAPAKAADLAPPKACPGELSYFQLYVAERFRIKIYQSSGHETQKQDGKKKKTFSHHNIMCDR